MDTKKGNLYLIPCTLGDTPPLEVLPLLVKKAIEEIDHYIVEHEKNARRFIKSIAPRKPQPSLHFNLINKFTDDSEIPSMLAPCHDGLDVTLCPASQSLYTEANGLVTWHSCILRRSGWASLMTNVTTFSPLLDISDPFAAE